MEFPPATFLLSDIFVIFLMVLGYKALWRRQLPGDQASAAFVAVALAAPTLMMLMAISATYRYRAEFIPFFEFAAFLGIFPLAAALDRAGRAWAAASVPMVATSVAASFAFLGSYKVA